MSMLSTGARSRSQSLPRKARKLAISRSRRVAFARGLARHPGRRDRRAGSNRTPRARPARRPARRSRRSRPAPRARSSARSPARRRCTRRGRAAARRPCRSGISRSLIEKSCEVPVLPAETYFAPMKARALVPSRGTPISAFLITARCSGLTASWCATSGAISRASPVLTFSMVETRCGRNPTPSLAIVAIAMRLLHRRKGVVSLSDAGRDRVSQVPLAVLFAIVLAGEALAASIRATAARPAARPRCRCRSCCRSPNCAMKVVGDVDVGFARKHVVVGVAGDDDRLASCRRCRDRRACRRGSGARCPRADSTRGRRSFASPCACRR